MMISALAAMPFPLPLAQSGQTFWMPAGASTEAGAVDLMFYLILWICVFFFALIMGLMVYFVIRFRSRIGEPAAESATHNMPLEIVWTAIPLLLVIGIFVLGFRSYLALATPPQNAYEIQVTGQKWQWLFTYPNGWVDKELHVPLNEPVRLVMTSDDVIHSFFVPDFRIKKDVVPGRYTKAWFEATEVGDHWLFCAEYCGTGHSDMITKVVVHAPGEFEKWLENAANIYKDMPPAQAGAEMVKKFGCAMCHSIDGSSGTGPSFKDVFGHQMQMTDGSSVVADENYIRESIMDPQAKIVAGYQGVMPTFKGKIKDEQITWIIAYLKSLSTEQ